MEMETPTQQLNTYQQYFVDIHPTIQAENPTWSPQQITTEIGRRWSLEQMEVLVKQDTVVIRHKNKKIVLDGCGVAGALKLYLDGYRAKYGHEALYNFVDILPQVN